MIKLIIVTHGPLADAFKESGAMFFGDQVDQVATIGLLPTKSPEVLEKEIKAAVVQSGTKECLIFVDILAGTPFNVVALMIEELKEYHIECFAWGKYANSDGSISFKGINECSRTNRAHWRNIRCYYC